MCRHIFILFLLCISAPVVMAVERIEVQALMPGMVVVKVDGIRVTLKPGQAAKQGVRLVSSDTTTAVLEVDGEQAEYKMGTRISTNFKARETIKEQIVLDKYGMFRAYGSINGHSVNYLIDTGASSVAMSSRDARKLGIQYHLDGIPMKANTASGIADGWNVTLKTVRLGKLVEHNVRGTVVDGDYPTNVLLGMTFLNRMKVEKEGQTLTIIQQQ